ncbi:MAG TPA: hypothetical protein VFK50_02450 [Sphingomicrobium sp.]|nr:hypothetical protein [Sphingomicrobium sp.]
MATVAQPAIEPGPRPDYLTGTERAHALDRWIFVGMAAWFIAIVLAGFIPDSLMKIEMVRAGQRPPFPMILHAHAVLMGSFLLLLFGQTWLMATGRRNQHMQLGIAGAALAAALVVVGFLLVGTTYDSLYAMSRAANPAVSEAGTKALRGYENIMLLQIRIGILFPLFLAIGFRARGTNSGLHKRMMILATAMALPAGIDRIPWIPHSMPASPLSPDLYTLLAVAPLLVWDLVRNGYLHRAWGIWLAINIPFAILLNALWDAPGWHAFVKGMMGVG